MAAFDLQRQKRMERKEKNRENIGKCKKGILTKVFVVRMPFFGELAELVFFTILFAILRKGLKSKKELDIIGVWRKK